MKVFVCLVVLIQSVFMLPQKDDSLLTAILYPKELEEEYAENSAEKTYPKALYQKMYPEIIEAERPVEQNDSESANVDFNIISSITENVSQSAARLEDFSSLVAPIYFPLNSEELSVEENLESSREEAISTSLNKKIVQSGVRSFRSQLSSEPIYFPLDSDEERYQKPPIEKMYSKPAVEENDLESLTESLTKEFNTIFSVKKPITQSTARSVNLQLPVEPIYFPLSSEDAEEEINTSSIKNTVFRSTVRPASPKLSGEPIFFPLNSGEKIYQKQSVEKMTLEPSGKGNHPKVPNEAFRTISVNKKSTVSPANFQLAVKPIYFKPLSEELPFGERLDEETSTTALNMKTVPQSTVKPVSSKWSVKLPYSKSFYSEEETYENQLAEEIHTEPPVEKEYLESLVLEINTVLPSIDEIYSESPLEEKYPDLSNEEFNTILSIKKIDTQSTVKSTDSQLSVKPIIFKPLSAEKGMYQTPDNDEDSEALDKEISTTSSTAKNIPKNTVRPEGSKSSAIPPYFTPFNSEEEIYEDPSFEEVYTEPPDKEEDLELLLVENDTILPSIQEIYSKPPVEQKDPESSNNVYNNISSIRKTVIHSTVKSVDPQLSVNYSNPLNPEKEIDQKPLVGEINLERSVEEEQPEPTNEEINTISLSKKIVSQSTVRSVDTHLSVKPTHYEPLQSEEEMYKKPSTDEMYTESPAEKQDSKPLIAEVNTPSSIKKNIPQLSVNPVYSQPSARPTYSKPQSEEMYSGPTAEVVHPKPFNGEVQQTHSVPWYPKPSNRPIYSQESNVPTFVTPTIPKQERPVYLNPSYVNEGGLSTNPKPLYPTSSDSLMYQQPYYMHQETVPTYPMYPEPSHRPMYSQSSNKLIYSQPYARPIYFESPEKPFYESEGRPMNPQMSRPIYQEPYNRPIFVEAYEEPTYQESYYRPLSHKQIWINNSPNRYPERRGSSQESRQKFRDSASRESISRESASEESKSSESSSSEN